MNTQLDEKNKFINVIYNTVTLIRMCSAVFRRVSILKLSLRFFCNLAIRYLFFEFTLSSCELKMELRENVS